jgi:hypothetical protein
MSDRISADSKFDGKEMCWMELKSGLNKHNYLLQCWTLIIETNKTNFTLLSQNSNLRAAHRAAGRVHKLLGLRDRTVAKKK